MAGSKKILIILGFAAVVLTSCGKPDKGTSPAVAVESQYEVLKPVVDDAVLDVLEIVTFGFDDFENFDPEFNSPPGLGKVAIPPLPQPPVVSVYQNGWHIFSINEQSDTISISFADSIRFTDVQGTAQPIPDEETTDGVRFIQHVEMTIQSEMLNASLSLYGDYSFSGFLSSTIRVDGTEISSISFSGVDERGTTSMELEMEVGITDVTIANPRVGGSGCPQSGTITLKLAGSFSGFDESGHRVTGNLDADVTVNIGGDGSANYVLNIDGSNYTESVNVCN